MLLFHASRFPAPFLRPSTFDLVKVRRRAGDATNTESRERLIAVVLLLSVLAAGVYGEILRYAF